MCELNKYVAFSVSQRSKSDTAEHTATCQKEKSLHTTLSAQCMHNLKGRCSVIGKV